MHSCASEPLLTISLKPFPGVLGCTGAQQMLGSGVSTRARSWSAALPPQSQISIALWTTMTTGRLHTAQCRLPVSSAPRQVCRGATCVPSLLCEQPSVGHTTSSRAGDFLCRMHRIRTRCWPAGEGCPPKGGSRGSFSCKMEFLIPFLLENEKTYWYPSDSTPNTCAVSAALVTG